MSGHSGALSSLVMTLPLIAVPCLAIFGLPSLGPTAAEAETADGGIDLAKDADLGPAAGAAPPGDDAFGPIVDAGKTAEAAGSDSRDAIDPTFDRRGAAANTAKGLDLPPGPSGIAPDSGFPPDDLAPRMPPEPPARGFGASDSLLGSAPPSSPAKAVASLPEAVARLNGLGINDYYLAPGEKPGAFHFSCAYEVRGPRKETRRFEAEAGDPVAAAVDVLAQIEEWAAGR